VQTYHLTAEAQIRQLTPFYPNYRPKTNITKKKTLQNEEETSATHPVKKLKQIKVNP